MAVLNYAEEQALENLKKLDVHLETDEVFILHTGTAAMITASVSEQRWQYYAEVMQPGAVYNVPRKVWHNIAMKPGSSVYIVENKDTHLGDFEFHDLDAAERTRMRDAVNAAWDPGS